MKKNLIFLILTFLLFIGCQSSSKKEIAEKEPLNPKVILSNLEKNNNNLFTGNIQIIETNDFYSNVSFSNIKLLSDTCRVTQFIANKNQILNGEVLTFDANITCEEDNPTLKITFNETAKYMDTEIKTLNKFFTKEIEINSTSINNEIKIANIQPSSISINEDGNFTFYVYTFDRNNSPVSTEVKIGPPVDRHGNIVGEFNKYLIITDENGKGSFTYYAPSSLNSNEINLTIPVTINNNITKYIYINVKKTNNNTPSPEVMIANIQPSSVSINEGGNFTFYVYTFDRNNSPVSTEVKIDPPVDRHGNIVGEFNKYLITTDENGKGSFTYYAPSSLNSNEINLTIPVTINNNITKYIYINVKKTFEITIHPTKLILIPNSITITGGSIYTIRILTLDNNNRGVSATVNISHPIDNNNNSWGYFDEYTVNTNENGEATVTFTANNDITNLGNSLAVPITVQSASLTQNLLLIKPSSTTQEAISYKINYEVPDSVQIEKNFNINLQILNEKTNELINSNDIIDINLSSENHLVYFESNSSKFSTTIHNINNINVPATTGKTSGIDIVDVNISINSNGNIKNIYEQIPVVVISGPVSSISINSIDSRYDSSTGLFVHTYSIHAVDKYSNPVQAGTKITVGAILNPKKIGNNGELRSISGSYKSEFNDSTQNFTNDLINNTLIILADANHNDPLYLGGWIIDNVDIINHKLILSSVYSGSDVSNLSYVIGDEKKYNICTSSLSVADFDSENKTYRTDNSGIAKVKLRFDPYLIGKTITLYANSYQNKRVGISIKEILLNNNILTKEKNEDETDANNNPINHNDGIWEKTGNQNDNLRGTITIGVNDGPYNTELSSSSSTLAQNSPVSLQILTPSICSFNNQYHIDLFTNCNGSVIFDVNYSRNGKCKVQFIGFKYEY
jgi:hypothetical protein